MIVATLIVDIFLLVLTTIRNAPPVLDSFLIYLILLICWVAYIAVFIGSLIYLVKFFKNNHTKAFIPILLNIFTLAIVLTLPLGQKWEGRVFASHLKEYETIVSMAKRGELSAKPNSHPYVHPNKVTVSNFHLPNQFKDLASFVIIYRWDTTTVVFFVRDGFAGRYGGYCYTSENQPPNKSYESKSNDEPHLYLSSGKMLLPHWYGCSSM